VTAIESPRSLGSILEEPGLVLAAHPGAPPLALDAADKIVALLGPEGGWSHNELSLFASRGVTLFGLGPRTLRTETAAIAAATLLLFLAGDLGS
jgi:16S rRNA (uracil1498-N3)-methyltransferase